MPRYLRPAVYGWAIPAGLAVGLAILPVSWLGQASLQPQSESLTPADGVGQTFLVEFDRPTSLLLSASFPPDNRGPSAPITAYITSSSAPQLHFQIAPVRADPLLGRLAIPLDRTATTLGASISVVISDPAHTVWLHGTESDSYPHGSRLSANRPVDGDLAFQVLYRRSLLDISLDGVVVALTSWRLILVACATIGSAALFVSGLFRRRNDLNLLALASLGIGGGLLLIVFAGMALVLIHGSLSTPFLAAATAIIGLIGIWIWSRPVPRLPAAHSPTAIVLLCLSLLALVRIGFISGLSLPLYSDSIEHYLIVTDLIKPEHSSYALHQIQNLPTIYYHFGFHALAAWIMALTGTNEPASILVIGQLIQIAAIAGVYFPVYVLLRDHTAASIALILAGLGWSMPAYATNWGKYPAILAVAVFPSLVGFVILAAASGRKKRRLALFVAGAAAIAAILVHTRVAFLFAAFLVSLGTAMVLSRSRITPTSTSAILLLVGTGGVLLVAATLDWPHAYRALRETLESYTQYQGAAATLVVVATFPIALRNYGRPVWTIALFAALTLVLRLVPPKAPAPFPLLDGPMINLTLYMPLAALGGAGLSAVIKPMASRAPDRLPYHSIPLRLAVIAAIPLAWIVTRPIGGPTETALIARGADIMAVTWAGQTLSRDDLLLIPSRPRYDPFPAPVDAGGWLPALDHLSTLLWPADADLASSTIYTELCRLGVTAVYAGGTAHSFTRTQLDLSPSLYSPLFATQGAAIYALVGCRAP